MQSFLVSHAIYAIVVFGVLEAYVHTDFLGTDVPARRRDRSQAGSPVPSSIPSLLLVIALGTPELVETFIWQYIGRVGGKPLVRRWGRYVLVTEGDVARAERFLVGRGAWALPVARMLPFVRAFASIVAGLVDIPPVRFGVLSLIGTLVYVVVLSSIGYSLGGEWSKLNQSLSVATYILVAVVVVLLVGFVIHRLREFRREGAVGAAHNGRPRPTGFAAMGRPASWEIRDQFVQFARREIGGRPWSRIFCLAPRSTMTATPITSAPAASSASTAVSTELPVVDVSSSAMYLGGPPHRVPSILRCRPCVFSALRTTKASMGVPRLGRGVHHRGGNGVSTEGKAADRCSARTSSAAALSSAPVRPVAPADRQAPPGAGPRSWSNARRMTVRSRRATMPLDLILPAVPHDHPCLQSIREE